MMRAPRGLLLSFLLGCAKTGAPPAPPVLTGLRVELPQEAERLELPARAQTGHPRPEYWSFFPIAGRIWPLPELDTPRLAEDQETLRLWFSDRGYRSAEVDLELVPDRRGVARAAARRVPRDRSAANAWSVRFVVRPGPQTQLLGSSLRLNEELPAGLSGALKALLPRPGALDEARLEATEQAMRERLQAEGYAWPLVTRIVSPVTEEHAGEPGVFVAWELEAGAKATFGAFRVVGAEGLESSQIERAIKPPFEEGEPYELRDLLRLEKALGDLPAFAAVEVVPVQGPDPTEVPVEVRIASAPRAKLQPVWRVSSDPSLYNLGFGLAVDGRHLGSRLIRGRAHLEGGYRAFPVVFGPKKFFGNRGPWAGQGAEWDLALRPVQGLSVFTGERLILDPERGFSAWGGELEAGLRARPTTNLVVSAGPSVGLWAYFPNRAQGRLYAPWFAGTDPSMGPWARPLFRPVANLMEVRLRFAYSNTGPQDWPSAGARARLDLVPVGRAGETPYLRGTADWVRFFGPEGGGQVATRLRGGLTAYPDGVGAGEVLHLRHLMGGWNSLRSFGWAAVSSPGWDGDVNALRSGGNVLGSAHLDGRLPIAPRIALLGFVESGRVWEALRDGVDARSGLPVRGVHFGDLMSVTGAGVEIPSPLGPLRLAGAFRINREDGYPNWDPGRWGVHLVLGTQ